MLVSRADERERARALSRALETRDPVAARAVLEAAGLEPDYVEVADLDGPTLLVAARVGSTRLIDNVLLPKEDSTVTTRPRTPAPGTPAPGKLPLPEVAEMKRREHQRGERRDGEEELLFLDRDSGHGPFGESERGGLVIETHIGQREISHNAIIFRLFFEERFQFAARLPPTFLGGGMVPRNFLSPA